MKTLNTETENKGIMSASVHDAKSGAKIGTAIADWDEYRLWAEGPSDVCEARRCLCDSELERLGIDPSTIIFLLD